MTDLDRVTQAQRFIRQLREYHGCVAVPRVRAHYRWIARWWELEAMRGYESSGRSLEYAANYRWLVEMMDNGHAVHSDAHGVRIDGMTIEQFIKHQAKASKRRKR